MKSEQKLVRKEYVDFLRVVATFAVIVLHVSGAKWDTVQSDTVAWDIHNIYNNSVRWAVSVFVMISGALMLGREKSIKLLYRRNILRIITAFAFWSALYSVVGLVVYGWEVRTVIIQFFVGHYHMWFLFMIAGVYILIPFLNKIVNTMELTKYFLVIWFLFSFLFPLILMLLLKKSQLYGTHASNMLADVNFHFAIGYVGYFVLGFYLDKTAFGKIVEWIIYALGIAGWIITIVFRDNDSFAINILLQSVAIFVFAKNHCCGKKTKVWSEISKYCFGVYLVHAMLIELLDAVFGFNSNICHPILSIALNSIVVFVGSFVISRVIGHVPKLRDYLI